MSKTLGVKLNDAEAAVFQHWCEMHGMNTSETLGYLVQSIIKLQGEGIINNTKLLNLMRSFDLQCDVSRAVNLILPSGELAIVQTIYFITEKGKRGITAVLVEKGDKQLEALASLDASEMIDAVIKSTVPGIRRTLRDIQRQVGAANIVDTLLYLIDNHEQMHDEIAEDIAELFADNERHDYGGKADKEVVYKPHNKRSIKEPTQLTLFSDLFEHEQKAIKEAEDNEQGQELQTPDSIGALAEAGEEDEGSGEL